MLEVKFCHHLKMKACIIYTFSVSSMEAGVPERLEESKVPTLQGGFHQVSRYAAFKLHILQVINKLDNFHICSYVLA